MEDGQGVENCESRTDRRSRTRLIAILLVPALWLTGCRLAEREMADHTPQGCATCHVAIAQQWEESAHASAWTNPQFVERTSQHRRPQCLPCHASAPLLERPPGEPPQLRAEQRESGVDCSVCHQRGCGYAGPYRSHLGPHPAEQDTTRLPCSAFCGICHQQEHQEYAALYVPVANTGDAKQCVQCHMPTERARLTQAHLLSYVHPKRITHDHTFPVWTARVTAGTVEIGDPTVVWRSPTEVDVRFLLTNRGAGHRIPSGAFGHRTLRIAVELLDRHGQPIGQKEKSLFAGQQDCLAPGRSVPFTLVATVPEREQPLQARLLVERVNRDRSFRFTLAELTWPVKMQARASDIGQ
ncbi:MAG: multiheme c-type cytochrome [Planctomycetota bacterium]|nr:multiheme c-type cytochrome [Planctomycetota bacterium]